MKVYRYVTTLVKIPSNPNEVGIFSVRNEYNLVTQKDLLDVVNRNITHYDTNLEYGVLNTTKYTFNPSTSKVSTKNEDLEDPDTYPPECIDLYRTNGDDMVQIISFFPIDDKAFARVKGFIEPDAEYSGTLDLNDPSVYPIAKTDNLIKGINRYLELNLNTSFSKLWRQYIGVVDNKQALISRLFNKL